MEEKKKMPRCRKYKRRSNTNKTYVHLGACDIDEICSIIGRRVWAYPQFRKGLKKLLRELKP